jgi:hypothetical protein
MRYGVHRQLEGEADRIIRESLRGITSHAAKSDVLTPWKETERRRREVFVPSGTPDPAVRQGIFGRALNSDPAFRHLNSPGIAGPAPTADLGDGGLDAFMRSQE